MGHSTPHLPGCSVTVTAPELRALSMPATDFRYLSLTGEAQGGRILTVQSVPRVALAATALSQHWPVKEVGSSASSRQQGLHQDTQVFPMYKFTWGHGRVILEAKNLSRTPRVEKSPASLAMVDLHGPACPPRSRQRREPWREAGPGQPEAAHSELVMTP